MAKTKVQTPAIAPIRIAVGRGVQALLTLLQARFDGTVTERYRVMRLITRLENVEAIQACDRTRRELVEKHGKRDPRTGASTVENWAGFNEEYAKVTEERIEVADVKPLPFDYLDKFYFVRPSKDETKEPERIPLQPNDLKVLAPFFEAPEDLED